MFRNYFKTAFRSLVRNRTYSIINIAGLAAGIAVFLLIFVIMWFRWTFPRLRIDQLLNLEWKYLLPISLVNLLLTTLIAIEGWYF